MTQVEGGHRFRGLLSNLITFRRRCPPDPPSRPLVPSGAIPSAAVYAVLASNPRLVVVGCSGGATVDLGVEQILASCEPAFRDEWAAGARSQ